MESAELIVESGLAGARAARRMVRAALLDLADELAADAELVVAELVANAVLHGEAPVCLRLSCEDDWVRIEVEDGGRSVPVRGRSGSDAMTGRGLAVVAAIADSWGVEPLPTGKTVWAEISPVSRRQLLADEEPDVDALLAAWDDDPAEEHFEVLLGWAPTELLLAAKAHIDNIIRELALMDGSPGGVPDLPAETIARLMRVTEDFVEARAEIKRRALAAARRGEAFTELRLSLPLAAADAGLRYLAGLDEADRQARAARLLTLAAPPSHRVFREWYVRNLVDQLRAAGRGDSPPPVTPFTLVLAAELDGLSAQAAGRSGAS